MSHNAPGRRAGDLLGLGAFIGLCLTIAAIGARFTMPSIGTWYRALQKPFFNPPDWIFGPLWTVLYLMIAFAGWLAWRSRHVAGARDVDPAEAEVIASRSIRSVSVDDLASPDALVAAVRATGARNIYVHIALDVLDPSAVTGLADLVPFGLSVPTLTSAVTELRAAFTIVGASIVGFSPTSPAAATDDLPSILRIIGALTR